ncbi:hypothetical protein CI1B_42270 [Bradyrhizobium ivorense]|uniref:Uncharacterized protein n=1 Tax=Bradyrhizobium ivorense TaxID=2511166 RepID=A0A508TDW6_9BRAD|nr:hypothetical protein [Bradyrhizobium ivorense]VIO72155.1 hypothetical protein CI41S_35220 [Bradyrhizobium ivorense]VIO72581.1 hypothetical protein CI1B_42270 [Bradyrhizobium ivorense]
MENRKEGLIAAFATLAIASLISMVSATDAFAQCAECSVYQNRDPFTEGLAVKPAPAEGANAQAPSEATRRAHAEMRGRQHGRRVVSPDRQHR